MSDVHPANAGLDFAFQGSISREVLCNYLSRSMIVVDCGLGARRDDDLRMIRHTGAKYIARAGGAWVPTRSYIDSLPERKEAIAAMHEADDELVFEAAIFEDVSSEVEEITIPTWVLKAFDRPVEDRCFRYKKMIYRCRKYRNLFGRGFSVPDLTRLEARMFFYYLACRHIDAGYEGLHLGQVHLMGKHDRRWKAWTNLLSKVRAYAKEHARRGVVLINAHTFGITGADGRLLFDFHSFPVRGLAPENSVPHAATEDKPQEIIPGVGLQKRAKDLRYQDSIVNHSLGGTAPSGWRCHSLPYIAELDNWNGYTPARLDQPPRGEGIDWWGFDEISWFANQPKWYRAEWLQRTYDWVRTNDPAGFLEMPGRRTAALRQPDRSIRQEMYSASVNGGFGDEDAIREVWINSRRDGRSGCSRP